MLGRIKLSEVGDYLGTKHEGANIEIDGLNLVGKETEKESVLSYVTSKKYANKIKTLDRIKAIIVSHDDADTYYELFKERGGGIVLSNNPERDFYSLHEYLANEKGFYYPVINKSVSPKTVIHETAIIEDHVIIEDNVTIGAYSIVKDGSVIKHDSTIGNHTVVGAEGFQVLRIEGIPRKVRHFGGVVIGSNVQIGDHCTVCKTIFEGNTHVGDNSIIDNYCHIAHYATIGKRVIITPGVTIVGGVTIEDDCYIGAGATIMNKVCVHSGATVGIGAVVLHNVKSGSTVIGNPAKRLF